MIFKSLNEDHASVLNQLIVNIDDVPQHHRDHWILSLQCIFDTLLNDNCVVAIPLMRMLAFNCIK